MNIAQIIDAVLRKRGVISEEQRRNFLNPNYDQHTHDPYLLNDMSKAVKRLAQAHEKKEKVFIYGDYDIDGLSATAVLLDAFGSFGIDAEAYIPDRFEEGYGLNIDALRKIKGMGGQLVVTVDCGSTSVEVVDQSNALGLELIITDHHTVGDVLPDAVAVVNPKRTDNTYPFTDLAGVGVAFKLVQALQQKLSGLEPGQEKWLLDLVALGTVCDVVSLVDENRVLVAWGLEVWKQTRRPGLSALLAISGIQDPQTIDTTTMGFRVGPRLNASGRMKHAQLSLDVLTSPDAKNALEVAQELDEFNHARRAEQARILEQARALAIKDPNPVLVVAGEGWSHGIVGIVAAKLLEEFSKPSFVIEVMPDKGVAKGSARSFGDYKAVDAVRAFKPRISGGGHAAAAGISIKHTDVDAFRAAANEHYRSLKLTDQAQYLQLEPDVELDNFELITTDLTNALHTLAPFGRLNEEPLLLLRNVQLINQRLVGADKNHLQLIVSDTNGTVLRGIAFNQGQIEDTTLNLLVVLQESSFRPGTVEIIVKNYQVAVA